MKREKNIENSIKANRLHLTSNAEMDKKILGDILGVLEETKNKQSAPTVPNIWRMIMKSRITKLATAAIVVVAVVLSIVSLDKSVTSAYAFEQTVDAFENVRYMHLIRKNRDGQIADERWIEIGPQGFQVRYRQDTPPKLVVEDGKTTAVYHTDKNTMVLWDPKDKQYQWIGDLRGWLEDLAGDASMMIEENVDYNGRQAHHVRWLKLNQNAYIDAETKLPIAMIGYEISYEYPPAGTFDIVVPEGVELVDKRPGAESDTEPEWLANKLANDKVAGANFKSAGYALAGGDYKKAAELFESVVAVQPGRNWAWCWMGQAYYELGEYDNAIEAHSKVINMMGGPAYSHYARGLAYAMNNMPEAAREDIKKALPSMMRGLRHIEATSMFDNVDDPRRTGNKGSEQQRFVKMINRLRMATGQNFGYDPESSPEKIEEAISAWEQWYQSSGEIHVNPEAELVGIPGPLSAKEDPYLTAQMGEAEMEAIEEFRDYKEKILKGATYSNRSTPLRALLTMLSGLHAHDQEAVEDSFAIDPSKLGVAITEDAMAGLEKYLASYDILRAPAASENPFHGEFWPVYVKNAGDDDLADTLLLVFWNGQWRFCGNVGNPNAYWKEAVPKMREMLKQAGK